MCTSVNYIGDERIIGGVPTTPHKYPFMIRLISEDDTGVEGRCGASLINSQYAVTAAHCIRRTTGEEVASILAILGAHDTRTRSEKWTQPIPVDKWYFNNFDHVWINNDIAILKLARPVEFTEGVKPICLPPDGHIYSKGVVQALGWGGIKDEPLEMSVELREADLEVLPESECKKIYEHQYHPETMICAGHLDGSKDTCVGDSGGPLFIYDDKLEPTLIGLTSFAGNGCGRRGLLATYTRVAVFTKWIVSKAGRGGPICFGTFNS